jgi:predicted lipoprotein with Yx(FWY)xxD motif
LRPSRSSHRRGRGAIGAGVLIIAAAIVAMTAFAAAKSATLTVAAVHLTGPSGKRTESIAVTGRGVAVYELGGESSHHLLCTSAACLKFWPPLKVAAGTKPSASGFAGRLGTLRRAGFTQVTLNGHPVYTFLQDGGKRGVATGDGVVAFGGTWRVFKEGRGGSAARPVSAPTTTTTSTNPYGY